MNAGGRSKFAPFAPFDFSGDEYSTRLSAYLDFAAGLGFSVLRVPFVWAAVEPSKGMDDEAFLSRYDALLDAAWQRRMWTIVDFHQDIYAESFCGDGFPAWTIPDPKPMPHHDCPDWFVHYSKDDDVRLAFDRFWKDEGGVQADFRSFWDRMVMRHKGRAGVIGYEVINEPHPGNMDATVWAKTVLTPFYSEMASRMHSLDAEALVFFDATGTDAIGAQTAMDRPMGQGLVFAPHWYDPGALFGGVPAPSNATEGLRSWAMQGEAWDLPLLVGESGVPRGLENASEFLPALYAGMDENGLHFAYWEYSDSKEQWNDEDLSIVGLDGKPAEGIVDLIARPFARAVAGEAVSFGFDAQTRVFALGYEATMAEGVTEIAVPERAYPSGYWVEASSGCVDSSRPGLLLVKGQEGKVKVSVHPR